MSMGIMEEILFNIDRFPDYGSFRLVKDTGCFYGQAVQIHRIMGYDFITGFGDKDRI